MDTVMTRSKEKLPEEPTLLIDSAKKLSLSDEQEKRLIKEIYEEFDKIKAERDNEHLDSFFDTMDNQYDGKMPRRKNAMFNLNDPVTKRILNDIVGSISDSHFTVDPMMTITPRPEFAKRDGYEVCEKQLEFVDSRLDEKIPYKSEFELAALSAALKKVGIIKWIHKIKKERRIGIETYVGKNEVVGQDEQGQPIIENSGIKEFLLIHGEEMEDNQAKFTGIIKQLMDEKTVRLDVEKDEVVYNDPCPKFIDNKNFFVRLKTNGYEGLCDARLIIERVNYTYYELKKLEKDNGFINIDELIKDDEGKTRPGAYSEDFDVLECTYYFSESNDGENIKVVVWIAEKKKMYLGGMHYPYTTLDCVYIPHYVKKTKTGFYQDGIAEDLTDIHIAGNAILNLALEDAYLANLLSLTPIVERDSDAAQQLLNKQWTPGMPFYGTRGEVGFMSETMKNPDIQSLLILKQELSRAGDEISGSSSLRTGRESQLDPKAPGNKTIALLKETRKNIRRYVAEFSKGFNQDINSILKIYYEISQEDQTYLPRNTVMVTGENPFKNISRGEMIAKTTIQSQAHAFDFDKLNEKATDLALYQTMMNEMLVQGNPMAKYHLIKTLIKGWSPKWKNNIDKILPPIEQFQQGLAQVALQATVQYFEQTAQQAQLTGQAPQLDPEQLLALIKDLQSRTTSTVEAEVERAKQDQQGG